MTRELLGFADAQGEFASSNSPMRAYQQCMSLAKQRLLILESTAFDAADWLRLEVAALNIRKVCEATALACLAAADIDLGPIALHHKRGWQADKQIRYALAKYPDCFPTPIDLHLNLMTRQHSAEKIVGIVLSPAELINVWIDVSNLLHEHNPYRRPKDLKEWRHKSKRYWDGLRSLLWVHAVQLPNHVIVSAFGANDPSPPITFVAGSPKKLFGPEASRGAT